MTALDQIVTLLPPPREPLYSSGDWEQVEQLLGVKLPDDYKIFIETYGQGAIHGADRYSGLIVYSYLQPSLPTTIAEGFSGYFQSIQSLPYSVFPNLPGLLGFASFGDKATIAWNASHTTSAIWEIVYHDPDIGFQTLVNTTFANFILATIDESSQLYRLGLIKPGHMRAPNTYTPEP